MADAVTVNGAFRIMYKEIQSWRLSYYRPKKGSASEFPRASQEGLILSGEGGEVKRLAVSPFSRVLSFWRASKTSPHPRRRQRSLQPVRSLRRKRATFARSKAADICFWVKEEREKEGRGERRERKRETSVYF